MVLKGVLLLVAASSPSWALRVQPHMFQWRADGPSFARPPHCAMEEEQQPAESPAPATSDQMGPAEMVASESQMGPKDYLTFFGYIGAFMVIFYAIAGVMNAVPVGR